MPELPASIRPRRRFRARLFLRLAIAGALAAAFAGTGLAAELRLRTECRCGHSLVRLGDVAEIHAADAEQLRKLEAVELFPAPAPGRHRFVRAREIQDLLALRGLNLAEHRLSGASQVQVAREEEAAAPPAMAPRPLSNSALTRASELATRAVVDYLRSEVSETESWQVELKLDADQARAVMAAVQPISAAGGEPPWKGCKRLELNVPGEAGVAETFEIEAIISTPPMVVTAVRSLVPGDTVQVTDVKLAERQSTLADEPFYRLEDVIGLQTTGAIVEGQVLDQSDVRSPLLVRRGDAVTIFARSAGIQVRTTARAQEDGSRGDLITVESMLDRQRFFARVTGIHEAEVFAHAAEVRAAPAAAASPPRISPVARSERRRPPAASPLDRQARPAGYQTTIIEPRRQSR